MKTSSSVVVFCLNVLTISALAGQGPAGASGACSHVIGPIDSTGNPIGFTCTNVGGNALLVWNASQLASDVTSTGNFNTLNYFPGNFFINGTFKANGPLGFIGGKITINGSVTASSVLIAGATTTQSELQNTLLGAAPSRLVTSTTARVFIGTTGRVTSTNKNLIVTGASIQNNGRLTANNGTVMLKTGSKLDIGWTDVHWLDGVHGAEGHSLINQGTITAKDAVLEARRTINNNPITNSGKITASNSITFVTGLPGNTGINGSFGIINGLGKLYSTQVIISPYSPAAPGGEPQDRVFNMKDAGDRTQLDNDIGGTSHRTNGNTPIGTTAAVVNPGQALTVTTDVVVPQLALSMTHLNSTSKPASSTIAVASARADQVRGDITQPTTAKPKPRVKARPLLVRGAFFDSKINAVIKSNR